MSVGEVLTRARAAAAAPRSLPEAADCAVDYDHHRSAGGAIERSRRRRGLLLPSICCRSSAHDAVSAAAAVHHDGDRIWPNAAACQQRGEDSARQRRISSRSFPRYKLARPFFRRVLADVDKFCMQSEESARGSSDWRRSQPGHRDGIPEVRLTGYSRHDRRRSQAKLRVLRYFRIVSGRPVLIAASTLKGEEEPVLEAFQRIRATWGNALLIIAPRKPERFDDVERIVRRAGWRVARRTRCPSMPSLASTSSSSTRLASSRSSIQVATVVFVGGSLVDAGSLTF